MSPSPSPKLSPREARTVWAAALRSGEYKQGRYVLRRGDDTYCCLGVACELFIKNGGTLTVERQDHTHHEIGRGEVITSNYKYDGCGSYLPDVVKNWLGLTCMRGEVKESANGGRHDYLSLMNDGGQKTFNDIADLIEADGIKVTE